MFFNLNGQDQVQPPPDVRSVADAETHEIRNTLEIKLP